MNVGAHMSIAGGLHRAIERAESEGATALQIFVRNQRQWDAKPMADDDRDRFREARLASGLSGVIAHASYLPNLASPDDALWERSISAITDELGRADALGLDALVLHPGAHMGSGVDAGLTRISRAVRRILDAHPRARCRLLFETTAGAGTQIGSRFDELARLMATSGPLDRLGVCLDTCHVYAAGHDIGSAAGYRRVRRELDAIVGLVHLHAVHVNDSEGALGSHLDRHAHIGRGEIGDAGFGALMRDPRLAAVPKILETPKGRTRGRTWDAVNLARLRRLARPKGHRR